jgi:hypothetical protein
VASDASTPVSWDSSVVGPLAGGQPVAEASSAGAGASLREGRLRSTPAMRKTPARMQEPIDA